MDGPLYEVVEYMALHDLDPAAVVSEDEQQVHGSHEQRRVHAHRKDMMMMTMMICGRDCVLPC
jgi:hypothetical protein